MNLLDPTWWLILSCIVAVLSAQALYTRLRRKTVVSSKFARAHVNIMGLGRARLAEVMGEACRTRSPITIGELEKAVDETMSIVHFLDIYPGMAVRPRMMHCVHRNEVLFVFTSPLTQVSLEYRVPLSAYLQL